MQASTSVSDRWKQVVDEACKRYTIQGVANMFGVTRNSISQYKNHGVLPDVESLIRYCEILDVDVRALIGSGRGGDGDLTSQYTSMVSTLRLLPREAKEELITELVKSL